MEPHIGTETARTTANALTDLPKLLIVVPVATAVARIAR